MRIGIDARMYGPKQGGLGRYIQQLILHLEKTSDNEEFVIFMRKENWEEYTPTNPRFTKVLADIPWYGFKEQLLFPRNIAKHNIDLMHFPHWNVPLGYNKPFIVTIHDLLLLHYPTRRASTLGPVMYWIKNKAYNKVLHHAIHKAKHIITTSNFTKDDIIKTFRLPEENMSVTYQAPTDLPDNPLKDTLAHYGIRKPFVLYVGVAYPHKNLLTLIKAWTEHKRTYRTNAQLVLVGKQNYFYNQLVSSAEWKNCPDIHYTGFIPDEHLPEIYRQASLYVMPSLYEGYALPSLEALSFNLPVVSSNTTCLPEVLSEAALYFDPNNTTDIARTLYEGLTDQKKRAAITEKSTELLQKYSGSALAKETLALYKKYGG